MNDKNDNEELKQVIEDKAKLQRSRELRARDERFLKWLTKYLIPIAVVLFVVVLGLLLWIYFG